MSKVERATTALTDAKQLALRLKAYELQLRQSISKKEHHEITSKLEKQIDDLERELDHAREENRKTIAINKQIAGVEQIIGALVKAANVQGKALGSIEEDASTHSKALMSQNKLLDTIAAKISLGMVPSQVYLRSIEKIRELEEDKRNMVRRFEYNSLEQRCQELTNRIGTMVPATEYASLKERFDEATRQVGAMVSSSDYAATRQRVEELEGTIATMVPREQLATSEGRVRELEARLSEHVPQSVYDELVSKVISLAEAVTGGAAPPEPKAADAELQQAEPATTAVEEVTAAEPTVVDESVPEPISEIEVQTTEVPAVETTTSSEPAPVQLEQVAPPVAAESTPAAAPAPAPEAPVIVAVEVTAEPVSEVSEIQSQLAELNARTQEARNPTAPTEGAGVQTTATTTSGPATFTFAGTGIEINTGEEFIQAIGKMPSGLLEAAVRGGDLERWFAGQLSDPSTAALLRQVREGGAVGEQLRSQVASAASKYAVITIAPATDEQPAEMMAATPDGAQTA